MPRTPWTRFWERVNLRLIKFAERKAREREALIEHFGHEPTRP